MEIADILIWGGLGFIIVRFLLPRLLDLLGIGIEKRPKNPNDDAK